MRNLLRAAVLFSGTLALAACAADDGAAGVAGDEDDLTSLTARQRALTFEGVVYAAPGDDEAKILAAAHAQTQSAFGALLASEVAVQARELKNVDPRTFRKRSVTVVDDAGAKREMVEVRYTYTDNAVVPVAMARKTGLSLALLGQGYEPKTKEIVELCTKNDKEARDDAAGGLLWYDFNPTKASCRRAMQAEQRAIDAATAKLADPRKEIPALRANRVYLPVTMQLARAATATRATYPEYDRLFGGGADPSALTIVLLNGRLEYKRVEPKKEDGYYEWMAALDVILRENPDFAITKIEPPAPITSPTAAGRKWEGLGFKDFVRWTVYGDGWPQGLPASARDELSTKVGEMLDMHWVTLEKKVKVSIGDAPPKDLIIRIETLFGAEEDPAPHKRALERGDVVLYNGHSYIGYGPLDPENFRETRFPKSYQMFFFDSCVSYNYYERDFFGYKSDGSKSLDLVTNGLEAPEYLSGEAQGKFVAKLIGGSMPSYQTLLEAAKATDALRVVDGEIDNRFDPARTKIRLAKP